MEKTIVNQDGHIAVEDFAKYSLVIGTCDNARKLNLAEAKDGRADPADIVGGDVVDEGGISKGKVISLELTPLGKISGLFYSDECAAVKSAESCAAVAKSAERRLNKIAGHRH